MQDGYLRLRDNTGVLLAENDDISLGSDRNSLLTFTAKSTGNYYLEAGSFLDAYSGTYSLTVTAPTPGIVTNLALSVAIGGAATILSSLLTASDIDDTAAQLTYSISTAPSFGTLLKSGLAVTQFTQQDINSGLISYRENGTVTLSDSFIFQVVDPAGFRSPSTQFRIQIPSSTQPGTIIGAGVSAGTNGKHDVFLRTASNQLLYQQYDNGGPLAGQLGFIFQGKAWVVDAATTAIGSSQSFWGYGGHDVFLRNGAGQLVADEFAADGSALDGIALTFRGAPWIIAAGTTAVGAGQGFWGYGGHDVYLRTSAGQLVADEFDNAGAAISGIALTFLGNPWTITATTTAIGSGQGFWGYGGHDVYLRTGTGQLVADEFDSNGAAISGIALTFLGSPWIVDAATTAIGSGQGFWGYGGHDVFLRNGAGQLIADEFDSAGRAIDGIALTYLGNPLIVTPNTTAIGSGQSFWGYGGHDVFLRTGSGQLVAAEFADNGAIIDGTPLTFLGNPWIVDTATTAIGTGQNFWGYHGHDVFLRNGLGQVFAEEFDRTGAAIDARMLTFLGNPWVVDNATTVIGSGQGFWGFGGNDVFLHLGNGQLAADEFGSNGAVIAGISLTYLGTAWIVAPTVTAIGAGQSFWGYGGHDVFLRTGAGQLVAAEFADNGAIMDGTALTFIGNPWIVDTATIAIGTAQNFWGYHGHDVFLRNGLGQVLADEFGADGAAISCIGLTYNGAAWTVDTATHAIGAGHNFAGSGGNDVFLLNGLGQLGFGEFNAGGVATAPAMIFITGTGFVGPTTTIAATGQNLLAGGQTAGLHLFDRGR